MTASRRDLLNLLLVAPGLSAVAASPALAASAQAPARKLLFGRGAKIVMIGDSITAQDRKEAGEGLFEAIGKGWVALVDGLIRVFQPEQDLRIINMGVNGDTIRDLKERWTKDVTNHKPDWVVIMIGLNDVWRQLDTPGITADWVPLPEYEKTLEELVSSTLKKVSGGVVLMSSYVMEPNRQDRFRATLDTYSAAMRRTAEKHKLTFIDSQAAFDRILSSRIYSSEMAWDRVHPNHIGNVVLARAFLDGVGFNWGG